MEGLELEVEKEKGAIEVVRRGGRGKKWVGVGGREEEGREKETGMMFFLQKRPSTFEIKFSPFNILNFYDVALILITGCRPMDKNKTFYFSNKKILQRI